MPTTRPSCSRRSQGPRRLGRSAGWLLALALVVALLGRGGSAAESGKTITIGETNNPAQREQLLALFGAEDDDRIIEITVEDTKEAMDGIFDMSYITTAYSSTALTCRDLGDGLDVTTSNITLVTPGLYAMALVTAGIGDAELVVAGPNGLTGIEGMTALAGVFKSWEESPCASGATTSARLRLALEELTLTAQIGVALGAVDRQVGVQIATDIVLETQKTIVTDGLSQESDIDAVIAAQEQRAGVAIAPELRAQLLDLMVRLARTNIDWGTFAAGWTIDTNGDNTRITMRGDGIAIRNAQATATARAGAALTATAEAEAALTATAGAEAALTATAEADLSATAGAALTATADAQATQDAIAALTATAAAQPTATPIPAPTATPEPFAVAGKVVEIADGALTIEDAGGSEARYAVVESTTYLREGEQVELIDLDEGDSVDAMFDPTLNAVTSVNAHAASVGLLARMAWMGLFLPVALIAAPAFWLWRRREVEPFIVREAAA
ncbi:MAG TPA: DUF1002 domain-containing protein [Methylomirabilota bacterium]|nr:DUF1002 domain-containing protein [Methylomirabilota bacterium]